MADKTPKKTPKDLEHDHDHDHEMDQAYSKDAELHDRQLGGERSMTLEELKKPKAERPQDNDVPDDRER